MSFPKISVVIPVYNVEKYLRQCLDSIIGQTLKDIEIICVDDGSTDGSKSILEEYAPNYPFIKTVYQKNQGAGMSRNAGLNIAAGHYIHFLDSDDYLSDIDIYNNIYDKASRNNLDIIRCKTYTVDDKTGEALYSKRNLQEWLPDNTFDKVINFSQNPLAFTKSCPSVWCGLFRRDFLNQYNIRFNNLKCVNDRSFWAHSFIKAARAMFVKDYLIYHRSNIDNSLVSLRAQNFHCQFLSYKIVANIVKNLPDNLKTIVLLEELHDIAVWYKKFQNSIYACKKIDSQIRKFLPSIKKSMIDKKHTLYPIIEKLSHKPLKFKDIVFSIRNENSHKVFRIFGLKIKFKNKQIDYK